jgi:solute carrier family 25 (mitochondrial citrate transporter), member 1
MIERSTVIGKEKSSSLKPGGFIKTSASDTKRSYVTTTNIRPTPRPKYIENPFPVTPGIDGFTNNVKDMYSTRGFRAFIQGFSPTLIRQVSNSVVRFTTYNLLKQMIHPNDSEPIGPYLSFGLGVVAGGVEVLATQPIDVIKTRMQSVNGIPKYRSMMFAGYRILAEEGPFALWLGLAPRFIRVTFSGGIIFAVYELTNSVVSQAVQENPFSWA